MDTEQTPHQQGLISAGAAAAASNTHTQRGGRAKHQCAACDRLWSTNLHL